MFCTGSRPFSVKFCVAFCRPLILYNSTSCELFSAIFIPSLYRPRWEAKASVAWTQMWWGPFKSGVIHMWKSFDFVYTTLRNTKKIWVVLIGNINHIKIFMRGFENEQFYKNALVVSKTVNFPCCFPIFVIKVEDSARTFWTKNDIDNNKSLCLIWFVIRMNNFLYFEVYKKSGPS
jgi:hypothetical protein